jgi:hypothetical protein
MFGRASLILWPVERYVTTTVSDKVGEGAPWLISISTRQDKMVTTIVTSTIMISSNFGMLLFMIKQSTNP